MKCKCKRSTDLDYVKAIEIANDIWVRTLNKKCKFRKDSQIIFTVIIF